MREGRRQRAEKPPPEVPAEIALAVRQAVENHADEPGPLLQMLHDVQSSLGCVPAAAVPLLADALNLSRADVFGVVSFYKDFRSEPAGRHQVRICRAEACQSVGGEQLARDASARLGIDLGSTTSNAEITLDQVFCLGNCALGPSVEVDGKLHGRMTIDRLIGLVDHLTGRELSDV